MSRRPEPVRFGILAPTSTVARLAVLPAIEASHHAEVVATASATAGQDYADVLADPAVEAVYVPLPNGMHREWVERAAAAGKHVLCEKPLAVDAVDAAAMVEACERAGVVLLEAYMTPYHPRSVVLADVVASGRLGRLLRVDARFTFPHGVPTDHRWDPALGGGALADLGVYCLSPIFDAAEATGQPVPTQVATHAVLVGSGVDATTSGLLAFPGGLTGTFTCSFDAPESQVLEIVGTQASVRVEHAFTPDDGDDRLDVVRRDGRTESLTGLGGDPYRGMVDHFCAVVRGRSRSRRPPAQSVALAALCDRIRSEGSW